MTDDVTSRSRGLRYPPLSIRIFAALVVGLVAGALAARAGWDTDRALAVATPVGKLWLDALTMTVVPLVFGMVVTGTAGAASSAASGGVAKRTLLWFAALLLMSCALAAIVATLILTAWPVDVAAGALGGQGAGPAPKVAAAGDWLTGIIPSNPIKAAADTAMVPLVVFALLFGFATARIAEPLATAVLTFFRATVEVMLVIVQWVLWLAPIGVLALAFGVGVHLGLGAAGTLAQYVVVVASCCIAGAVMVSLVAIVAGRTGPLRFVRAAFGPQVVAVSTQSSLASLPAMIEAAPALDVTREAAGVVLPLAVSLFRASSAAANVAVAVYLGHLHGVPLGPGTLAVGVATGAAVSLAAVGLPAQVSFFATIGPVCIAMGVPVAFLPVLLAVETVPDIFRTLGNVTSDLGVMRLAGRGAGEADSE